VHMSAYIPSVHIGSEKCECTLNVHMYMVGTIEDSYCGEVGQNRKTCVCICRHVYTTFIYTECSEFKCQNFRSV